MCVCVVVVSSAESKQAGVVCTGPSIRDKSRRIVDMETWAMGHGASTGTSTSTGTSIDISAPGNQQTGRPKAEASRRGKGWWFHRVACGIAA